MLKTLCAGLLSLALASCSTICFSPSSCGFRSSHGGMSNSDAASLSRVIGGVK